MEYQFSDRLKNLEGNAIREIFKLLAQPGIISFAGGMPASEALPVDEVREILEGLLHGQQGVTLLQYGGTEGYGPYLEAGMEYLKRKGIFGLKRENVLAVSGGQQGIDLIGKAFLNKGDAVLVEDPTYLAVLHILKTYEANPIGVKSGEDGMDLTDLEGKIQKYHPKFVYVVSTFGNPTGKTMTAEHRKQIAEMTAKYGVMLIEDDPYGELRYSGEKADAIKSYDKTGNVVFLTSFSKTVSPGMRIGLAAGDASVIRKMTIGKQATDVHTNALSQAVVAEFLSRGLLDETLKKNLPLYRKKRDAMLSAIEKYFPSDVNFTRPEGGLFIWVELPEDVNASKLFPTAVERKVAYVTGNSFFADGRGDNTMRLNFSNATVEQIDTGIKTLGELLKETELSVRK